ncbi:MAG TPA: thioredoxin domain-containing protein [Fibrobacteria bacterium]|nr:thioredoxin domain-containing protein [Fibrobacteria bacterium]
MRRLWLLALPLTVLLAQCTTPSMENRLSKLEAKQDSILKMLGAMQEKHEFMAMRMGWRPPPDTTPKAIPLGTSKVQGPENASFTIVEFSDLQCPYCAQTAPVLDSIAHAYPNDVRVVFKHFPLSFHPQAKAAAAASIAAGKQGKFFEFRYKVAPHFRDLKDSLYLGLAKELGLDLEQFKHDMALTPEVERLLEEDVNLGRKIGVEGTPTIFVNGRLAQDRSFEYFERMIKQSKTN